MSTGDADAPSPPSAVDTQLEAGHAAYSDGCASCHGATGLGTAYGPQVAGDAALPLDPPPTRRIRTTTFRTALDVYDFTAETMPYDDPGSLDEPTCLALVAFILSWNDVPLEAPLTIDDAGGVVINP
jgi:cytochrome c